MTQPYRRILLKLSGEMLLDKQHPFGISSTACQHLAKSIKAFKRLGIQVALVIGGGNLFRGSDLKELGMERSPADQMGMLATLINGIALQQALEQEECPARILTALECPRVAETYNWHNAIKYVAAGDVLIFTGGTGNPFFTTDTAAAMRACEIKADILLKATKVDGVYNKDPLKHPDAVKYPTLTYSQMLAENLAVMDATSVALCRSSRLPILVFNMQWLKTSHPADILEKTHLGTLVSGD